MYRRLEPTISVTSIATRCQLWERSSNKQVWTGLAHQISLQVGSSSEDVSSTGAESPNVQCLEEAEPGPENGGEAGAGARAVPT